MGLSHSSYSQPSIVSESWRSKIHPINAQYLCQDQPHRIYADTTRAILELTVRPIAQTVVESHISHGGIVGIRYQTHHSEMVDTVILNRQWDFSIFNEYGFTDPCFIEDHILYMLLNPVDMNGWYHMPSTDHEEIMKEIGMSPQTLRSKQISQAMAQAIKKTQEQYRFLLQARQV